MASSGDQLPDSYGYNLHARLIGAVPEAGADLFLAIFFGIIYWLACAYGINKWLSKQKRNDVEIQPFKVRARLSSTWVSQHAPAKRLAHFELAFGIRHGYCSGYRSRVFGWD